MKTLARICVQLRIKLEKIGLLLFWAFRGNQVDDNCYYLQATDCGSVLTKKHVNPDSKVEYSVYNNDGNHSLQWRGILVSDRMHFDDANAILDSNSVEAWGETKRCPPLPAHFL